MTTTPEENTVTAARSRITVHRSERSLAFLDDYCAACNPLGHYADSAVRLASLTEPEALTWHGGMRVLCRYRCVRCGHRWRRSDLWDARSAGLVPNPCTAA
ncbi:hypothetical protein [Mycobacterium sp. SMC-14]|uniref:hypothetical protein n=1 Tax=Mycobacterium sp. SMC-14 TaxID=3385968 RepID=UPI00390C8FA0